MPDINRDVKYFFPLSNLPKRGRMPGANHEDAAFVGTESHVMNLGSNVAKGLGERLCGLGIPYLALAVGGGGCRWKWKNKRNGRPRPTTHGFPNQARGPSESVSLINRAP
jgi:hypothetical protein